MNRANANRFKFNETRRSHREKQSRVSKRNRVPQIFGLIICAIVILAVVVTGISLPAARADSPTKVEAGVNNYIGVDLRALIPTGNVYEYGEGIGTDSLPGGYVYKVELTGQKGEDGFITSSYSTAGGRGAYIYGWYDARYNGGVGIKYGVGGYPGYNGGNSTSYGGKGGNATVLWINEQLVAVAGGGGGAGGRRYGYYNSYGYSTSGYYGGGKGGDASSSSLGDIYYGDYGEADSGNLSVEGGGGNGGTSSGSGSGGYAGMYGGIKGSNGNGGTGGDGGGGGGYYGGSSGGGGGGGGGGYYGGGGGGGGGYNEYSDDNEQMMEGGAGGGGGAGASYVGGLSHLDAENEKYCDSYYSGTSAFLKITEYAVKNYTVTFNAGGGTGMPSFSSINWSYGLSEELPTVGSMVRPGHDFTGWGTQEDGYGTAIWGEESYVKLSSAVNSSDNICIDPLASHIAIYAQWTHGVYKISFDPGGGTGTPSHTHLLWEFDNETYMPDRGTMIRAGYTFAGWGRQEDGLGEVMWVEEEKVLLSTNDEKGGVGKDGTLNYANSEIYAQWTANKYDITFGGGGATGSPDASTVNWEFAVSKAMPGKGSLVRTGYTFAGWGRDSGGLGEVIWAAGETVVLGTNDEKGVAAGKSDGTGILNHANTSVYAQWTVNNYTITFGNGGGTGTVSPASIDWTYGTNKTMPTDDGLSRTGYTFAGWGRTANGLGAVIWGKSVTVTLGVSDSAGVLNYTDVNVYAQWTPNKYTVTFNTGGASGTPSSSVITDWTFETSKALPTIGNMVRTGYSFIGWGTQSDGLGAKIWDGGATVKLNASANGSEYINYGTATVYAQWTANNYTISFDAGGGAGAPVPTSLDWTFNSTKTMPAVGSMVRTGYDFAGWGRTTNGLGSVLWAKGATITLGASDIAGSTLKFDGGTVYAQWTPKEYIITFDAGGGTGEPEAITGWAFNTSKTLPGVGDLMRTGYSFEGWGTAANGTAVWAGGVLVTLSAGANSGTNINYQTSILYAQWKAKDVTVTYNANGGTVSPGTKSYKYNQTFTTHLDPQRTGYVFDGWYTLAVGGDLVDPATAITAANFPTMDTTVTPCTLELFAHWTARQVTVTYSNNYAGGTSQTKTVTYNGTYGMNGQWPANPTRAGYVFNGWNTASDGAGTIINSGTEVSIGTGVDTTPIHPALCTVTFYAQWTQRAVNVTYLYNYGAAGTYSAKTVLFDGLYGTDYPTNPTRTGYTFNGWNTASDGTGEPVTAASRVNTGVNSTPAHPLPCTISLYAQWKAIKYTITFNMGGATGTAPNSEAGWDYDTSRNLPSVGSMVRTGYDFIGWGTQSDGLGAKTWNGGAEVTLTDTDSGVKIAVDGTGAVLTRTVYAQWAARMFTVSFAGGNSTGGAVPAAISNWAYNSEKALPNQNMLTRTGYTFRGWGTQSNGLGAVIWAVGANVKVVNNSGTNTSLIIHVAGNEEPANVTLYAQWTINKFNLSFTTNTPDTGGTVSIAEPAHPYSISGDVISSSVADHFKDIAYGTSFNNIKGYGLPVLEYSGTSHIFGGWFTDIGLTKPAITADSTGADGSEIMLYARWNRADQITITFATYGGTAVAPITGDRNALVEKPIDPTREGYSFEGWYKVVIDHGSYVEYQLEFPWGGGRYTEALILHARWEKKQFKVAFDLNNATSPASITGWDNVLFGDELWSLVPAYGSGIYPQRTGHVFEGWEYTYTSYTTGGSVTLKVTEGSKMPDIDKNYSGPGATLTLRATWSKSIYRIIFTSAGGTIKQDTNALDFLEFSYQATFTGRLNNITADWTGRTFAGWKVMGESEMGTCTGDLTTWLKDNFTDGMPAYNLTLTAVWTMNKYTISFVLNASGTGTTPSPETIAPITGIEYEESIGKYFVFNAPTRPGYKFKGWSETGALGVAIDTTSYTMPASHVILTALWEQEFYTIQFNLNGGTWNPDLGLGIQTGKAYGDTIVFPGVPTIADGRTFLYWLDTADNIEWYEGMTVKGNQIFVAQYVAAQMVFVLNGGNIGGDTSDQTITGIAGDPWHMANPVKEGSIFVGWFDSSLTSEYTKTQFVTGSVTLYAKWAKKKFTIEFYDGTEKVGEVTNIETGENFAGRIPASILNYAITGRNLLGWFDGSGTEYVNASKTVVITSLSDVVQNNYVLKLYAKWDIITYTVTFTMNGVTKEVTGEPGITVNIPVEFSNPTQLGTSGYSWKSGGQTVMFPMLMPTWNMTVNLEWVYIEYKIKFVSGSTTVQEITTARYNEYISKYLPAAPTVSGKKFAGWQGYTPGMVVVGDHAFEAVYVDISAATSILEFKHSDLIQSGALIKQVTATNGQEVSLYLPDMTKIDIPGLVFIGWKEYTPGQKVTANTTYTAMYISSATNEVTIKFRDSDGTLIHEIKVTDGTQVWLIMPPSLEKDGKEFKGWATDYTGGQTVNAALGSEIEYTATWGTPTTPQDEDMLIILILLVLGVLLALIIFLAMKRKRSRKQTQQF